MQADKPLTGKDGVLVPLLENLLNAALEGEMDARIGEDGRLAGNRRSGYTGKQVQGSVDGLSISTPRDRDAAFDPVTVRKKERILADSLAGRPECAAANKPCV